MGVGRNQTYQKIRSARLCVLPMRGARLLSLCIPLLLSAAAPVFAQTAQTVHDALTKAEQAIAQAYDSLQKKQWSELKTLVFKAAVDPLLGGYPQYWHLREQLRDETVTVPDATLEQFIKHHHEDAYLVDRLKGEWLVAAVRQGNWQRAHQLEPVRHHNAAIACARVLMRHKTGTAVKAEQALNVLAPDEMCWRLLETLVQDKVVTWAALHGQLRNLLEANRRQDAQRMAALLFTPRQMRDYTALMQNPRKWLNGQGKSKPQNRAQRALASIALARLARSGPRPAAASYFEKQWAARLPEADRRWVWGQFALVAVLNGEPQAAIWYRNSGNGNKTEYNHAWQVRAELRRPKPDWKRVDAIIRQMRPEQQQQTAWLYWRARALAQTNHPQTAQRLYAQTAVHEDFYGLLAREELGLPLALPAPPATLASDDMEQIRANTGLQRAIRLFQLGARQEAVPAWNFALRGMNDRQLRAAAELAHQAHIYDRVINTALMAKTENDAAQRFVAPYEGPISAATQAVGIEAAWVYGLIRQESRFIANVRSSAGALGLMQLMPATAKWVAGKTGMKNFSPARVQDVYTNTLLGTHYLGMVLENFDGSQVLATAGYNAGPKRAEQWRGWLKTPVEGAIFTETIPFTETRLYVKHVLANTMHYALRLNAVSASGPSSSLPPPLPTLKARLGTISAPGAALAHNTDLP